MAVVKGQNLRIFVGDPAVVIAAAQQCELNVHLNTEQFSTKDDTGAFDNHQTVSLAWSLRTNGLVTNDPDRNDTDSMMDRIGQTVNVEFGVAGGEQNSDMEDLMLAGEAIISDITVVAANRENTTYQIQLTGTKDMLFPLGLLQTYDEYMIETSDGYQLACVDDGN